MHEFGDAAENQRESIAPDIASFVQHVMACILCCSAQQSVTKHMHVLGHIIYCQHTLNTAWCASASLCNHGNDASTTSQAPLNEAIQVSSKAA